MVHAASLPRRNRAAALTFVVALHLCLIILALAARSATQPVQASPGALTVVSIANAASTTPPPPPPLPSKIIEDNPVSQIVVAAEADSGPDAPAGSGCTTLEAVSKALLSDTEALGAVLAAPPDTRSIAEAIVVWNAGWSEATSSIEAPLGPVRVAVTSSLSSVEDNCLDEPIAGPRLIPIPAGQRTMFVVIGSGNWSWRQLLRQPDRLPLVPGKIDLLGAIKLQQRPNIRTQRNEAGTAHLNRNLPMLVRQ
jgi:hypothetical protein